MLATRKIPEKYHQWNLKHGAPFGHRILLQRLKEKIYSANRLRQAFGPFSIQTNNTIREFEYPWAFEAAAPQPNMKVLEIGGGLAGFQFALDAAGCQVVNVDPGGTAAGKEWLCDEKSISYLNRIFGTRVELRNTTMENARLADAEFDCAFCLSVIEHLTPEAAASVMTHAFRSLKPGGKFILTVDLFLNLTPFTKRTVNEFGSNQRIPELIQHQPWKLVSGQREELWGFPEFDSENILSNLEKYYVGHYPALAQCFVVQKAAA